MRSELRATSPEDAPRIAAFMIRVWDCPVGSPLIDPRHMAWRYWDERPDWSGGRSYVLERDGEIIAHGMAWPWTFQVDTGAVSGFTLVDWAADSAFPGAGAAVMKRIASLAPVVTVFSGTPMAKKMWPAIGFKPRNEVRIFGLPLRPLAQMTSRPERDWKTPGRFVRSATWNWRAPRAVAPGWTSARLAPEEQSSLWRYLSLCPAAQFEFHAVYKQGLRTGFFCLALTPGQARIADARVDGEALEDWIQLYRLATAQARRSGGMNEVKTYAALPVAQQALAACGYLDRDGGPVMAYDPTGALPQECVIPFQMIHTDDAFVHQGVPSYVT